MDIPPAELATVFGAESADHAESLRPRPLGATVGVWRIHAAGTSAVLKLLRLGASPNVNWAASADPAHPRWWRRELATLQEGIPDLLRPELRPPRLVHAADRPDGTVALWLEDLGQPAQWTLGSLSSVARLLGAAQARLSRDPPSALASGFLRAYLEPRIAHLSEPFASRRRELLELLEATTQTVCHFDMHPANVFPMREVTAVIDWAYCGLGPIGSDAGVLASDALADEIIAPAEAVELVGSVWAAYEEGLDDEQLSSEAAKVYAVATALRYSWLPAWIAGAYGPQPSETRAAGASAAHAAFHALALHHL